VSGVIARYARSALLNGYEPLVLETIEHDPGCTEFRMERDAQTARGISMRRVIQPDKDIWHTQHYLSPKKAVAAAP
jgi:hypothetical protein